MSPGECTRPACLLMGRKHRGVSTPHHDALAAWNTPLAAASLRPSDCRRSPTFLHRTVSRKTPRGGVLGFGWVFTGLDGFTTGVAGGGGGTGFARLYGVAATEGAYWVLPGKKAGWRLSIAMLTPPD